MNRLDYCSCCGAPRGLSATQHAHTISELLEVSEHRPLQRDAGQLYEIAPQLRVAVQVYRNGGGLGGREHVCDACLSIGIGYAIEKLTAMLPAQEVVHG